MSSCCCSISKHLMPCYSMLSYVILCQWNTREMLVPQSHSFIYIYMIAFLVDYHHPTSCSSLLPLYIQNILFSFLPSGWQFHFQRPFVQNSHHLSPACVSTIWNLHFKLSDWLISNPQPRSLTSLKQCHYFKNYIKLNDKLVPLFQPVVSISTAQCSVLDTWPFFFFDSPGEVTSNL